MRGVQQPRAESGIFVWTGQVARLIYLSRQPPPPPLPHTLFYYIHPFFFVSYIYTHTQQQKKNFAFSIKIIFDVDLS